MNVVHVPAVDKEALAILEREDDLEEIINMGRVTGGQYTNTCQIAR